MTLIFFVTMIIATNDGDQQAFALLRIILRTCF